MKLTKIIMVLILAIQIANAQKAPINQYAAIDKKALQLPDSLSKSTDGISRYIKNNFKTDKDKSRAIFIWVATNIRYDVENRYAINFYEKKEEKIAKPLRTGKEFAKIMQHCLRISP